MKQLFNILVLLLVANIAVAQAPQGIPYQAAARNSSGAVLASTAISVRFTIRDSIATGAIKYRETHSVTTTAQGMFSVNVGQGTVVSGTFSGINWVDNVIYLYLYTGDYQRGYSKVWSNVFNKIGICSRKQLG